MSPFPHLQKQRSQTTHFNSTFLRPQTCSEQLRRVKRTGFNLVAGKYARDGDLAEKSGRGETKLCFGDEAHWAKRPRGMNLTFATGTLAFQQRKETRLQQNQNRERVFSTFRFEIHL